MNKLNKNESGIAHLAAIILIVLIVAISGVGWYIYDRQQNKNTENAQSSNLQNTQDTAEQSDNSTDEQTYKSKRYTSSKGAFSMELLNGWTVEKDTTYDYFFQYSVSKLKYDEAKMPTVKETKNSGVGGYVPGIKVSINEYNEEINTGEKFTLNDGTMGYCKKSVTTKEEDTVGIMADSLGSFIQKDCFFKKNNQKLLASYSYYEKEPLDVKAVEHSFKTIKFEK